MAIIEFKDEAAWHALRAKNVGASEVAALFGLSPWTTKWKLFMQKSGKLPDNRSKGWMDRGRHFEPAIASYAREEFELPIVKVNHYWTDEDCPGLGSSLDYTLADDNGVPVEIKWNERYDGWEWEADELTQIPDNYLLQVQHQMACTGAQRGMLIAFVGGTVRRVLIPRSEALIRAIRSHVTQFWKDIADGIEPPVDFLQDAGVIMDIARHRPLRSIELPPHAVALCELFVTETAKAKEAEELATRAKAEIVKIVMDAGTGNDGQAVATCPGFSVKLTKVADSPGKLVELDMVGQYVGARKGYLRTTVTKKG